MTNYNDLGFEWEGVIAYLDTPTEDGRFISSTDFLVKLPAVVRVLQPAKWPGINPLIVGKIKHVWFDGTKVIGSGTSNQELTGPAVPDMEPRTNRLLAVTFGSESAWANHEPVTCKSRQPEGQ